MLHVVTGAPCAGKTTFVREHKQSGDIVIDMDALAVSLGADDMHSYPEGIRKAALAARRAAIDSIGDSNAWVIHTQPTDEQRAAYKGAVFHDLDPGKDECINRAKRDNRPNGTVEAITQFYEKTGLSPFSDSREERQSNQPAKSGFFYARKGREGVHMAEPENVQATTEGETPEDWKAKYEAMREHSREWEQRAKANKAAADELQEIKAAQMSEQEKLTARAEAAEQKLAELEALQAHEKAAKEIANETGVPVELLEFCTDETAMRDFAKQYGEQKPPVAPSAAAARIIRGDKGKPSTREQFAEFLDNAGF